MGAFETPSLSVIASQTLNLALLWFATPPGFTGWYCTGGAGVGGGFEGSRHSRSLSPPEFHKVAQRGFYQTGPCGRFRSKCSVLNKRDHSELRAAQDQMAVAILPPPLPPYPPTPTLTGRTQGLTASQIDLLNWCDCSPFFLNTNNNSSKKRDGALPKSAISYHSNLLVWDCCPPENGAAARVHTCEAR